MTFACNCIVYHLKFTSFFYFQVNLSLSDIETILNTLVFDGKIEQSIAGDDDTKIYRAVDSFTNLSPIMTIPCGVCPVSIKL